jgi:hypothetical protein
MNTACPSPNCSSRSGLTATEQRLRDVCRRLLTQNDKLHARTDYLHEVIWRLGAQCRSLQADLDRAKQDQAAKEEASDVLLGAALDAALGTSRSQP